MQLYALVFTLFFCANGLIGQCDSIIYIPVLDYIASQVDGRPETSLCSERDRCLQRLITCFDKADIDAADETFSEFIANEENGFFSKIEVAYVYASILERLGSVDVANVYYRYVKTKTKEGSYLNFLAAISVTSMSPTTNMLGELDVRLNKTMKDDALTSDQKAAAILKYSYLLQVLSKTDLSKKYIDFAVTVKNPVLRYLLLDELVLRLIESEDKSIERYKDTLDQAYSEVNEQRHVIRKLRLEVRHQLAQGNYKKALHTANENLKNKYSEEVINEYLLAKIQQINRHNGEIRVLTSYATAKLFQTRLGAGMATVDTAFQIFDAIGIADLEDRLTNAVGLYTFRNSNLEIAYLNNFVVGQYLYEKTSDTSYLDRTLSFVDAFSAGGLYRALLFNGVAKTKPEFGMKAANIERNLREVDGALNSTNTLLDIYAAVKSFTESKEAFRREYKEYYDLLLSNYQVNMQSLQKKLASDSSMAIAFYKSDRGLYRLTVTGEILRADRMNYSNEMDSLATEIGILAQTNQKNTRLPQISHRLYQLLLADLDTLLPNALHIVANDNLETLPFNLLRKDSLTNNPRYLGVEHAISRQFSLRTMEMLNALRPAPKYHQPLALAPDFKESTDPTISALSYNEKEVTWLEEISGGAFYTSARATLDRYHEYAPNYGIIHLATHAKSNQQDGLESRIYFVDADNQPVALNARDIAQEKLEAELIVLSACETSRGGQNTVEGTIGLTRAYFAAGARTVVASNWAVNDFATAEMMQSFYNYTAEGQPAHIALQNARRDYREAHPDAHPSRWAAFEAFGGMQPVNWDRTKVWYGQISTTIWGGLLAAVCAVIGLFFYNRNRNYA